MKLMNRLKLRFNGSYRYRERVLGPSVKAEILRALDDGGFGSEPMDRYFREWLPYLDKMRKFADRARWIGKSLAYKSLGTDRDGVYRSISGPARFIDIFREGDHLSFNGVAMPLPEGRHDERLYLLLFHELVVAYFFRKTCPLLCQFFTSGYYENEIIELNKGDVVFDFGANSGFFAACASHSGCSVHAFEPTEYNRKYLNKTAMLNPSITVCPVALSDKKETLEFFIVADNSGRTREVNSLPLVKGGRPDGFIETVQAVAIDDYIDEMGVDRVDFIKADIEGAERHMLAGARKVLKKYAPKLALCTYHLPDDPEVMRKIILEANPHYTIHQGGSMMYAHV